MKQIFSYLLVAGLVLACGKASQPEPDTKQSGNPPTTQPTTSPKPTPTASGIKWTQEELNTLVGYCADYGNEDYTYDTWKNFCGCIYTAAAKKWTYSEFIQNYETYLDQLYDEKAFATCAKSAGMI